MRPHQVNDQVNKTDKDSFVRGNSLESTSDACFISAVYDVVGHIIGLAVNVIATHLY